MAAGVVKWFDNRKGYGFIVPEDSSNEVFVHYSVISTEGYKTLQEGQSVQYEVKETARGLQAVDVTCEEAPPPA